MLFRLTDLEGIAVRQQLADTPDVVLARATESLAASEQALGAAENLLVDVREKRAATTNKHLAYAQELDVATSSLINSRKLALADDVGTAWREADKNKRRQQELKLLVEYTVSWLAPADAVACLEAEIEVESCRADLWEAQAVLQRCKIFIAAVDAREIDSRVKIDLSGSASADLLKRVERSRRQVVPEMMTRLETLVEKRDAARAASSIFA